MLYAFVVLVDPWGVLPLSPPLPRVPISSNARYSFPALARAGRFDAVLLGTSTSRLLQPAELDPLLHLHLVNLAMNSATAWEQTQLLDVFLRAHPHPRAVLIGLDASWCSAAAPRLTPRAFPAWMYRGSRWAGYLHMLTPYAVQEAANQVAVMLGLKRRRYGLDGYTRFVPPEAAYDPARVDAAFAHWLPTDDDPARPADPMPLPGLDMLDAALAAVPPGTRVLLFFLPINVERQGAPGSRVAARWAACKARVTELAVSHGAEALDFLFPSPLTDRRTQYWDPLHYRRSVATLIGERLARPTGHDVRVLAPPRLFGRDAENEDSRPPP